MFWSARNFKIIGDKVVVGDANEIGDWKKWSGNILYGKILTGGNIDWVTVNKPEDMGYFHGVTMGDLNKDGLLDIGGTPGSWKFIEKGWDLDLFTKRALINSNLLTIQYQIMDQFGLKPHHLPWNLKTSLEIQEQRL